MRKVFIDCGAYTGNSVKKFLTVFDGFEIFSFEPNPFLKAYHDRLPNTLIEAAVWTENGTIDFYLDQKDYDGSSVFEHKQNIVDKKKISVPTIDFSRWLKENFDKNDLIILKMDIEGAEYPVLDKMIKEGTIEYINELLIEFHGHKIGLDLKIHDTLIRQLERYNINPVKWDAIDWERPQKKNTDLAYLKAKYPELLRRDVSNLTNHFGDNGRIVKPWAASRDYIDNNVTVIIRSVGERTESLCYERLKAQISEKNIHIVRETPFTEAVRKTFQIGMQENRKWTFAIDADVVILPDAIEKLVAFAETAKYDVFLVIGPVIDKFLESPRAVGYHFYRTQWITHATAFIPDPQLAIRPETHVRDRMKEKGFSYIKADFILGHHDFEQYYRDIYRKCFIHSKKHYKEVLKVLPKWNEMAGTDPDYRVAIAGFNDGIKYQGAVSIDIYAPFMAMFDDMIKKMSLSEKKRLCLSDPTLPHRSKVTERCSPDMAQPVSFYENPVASVNPVKSRGIVYVAFGTEYDKVAAYTACYSRQFTKMPFYVLTNLKERCPQWSHVDNVQFCYIKEADSNNRSVKTLLLDYSPYEETIYLDVDAVIRRKGIEQLFDYLASSDIVFAEQMKYRGCNGAFFQKYYKPVIEAMSLNPRSIATGAFFVFKRTEFTRRFFNRWNELWVQFGRNRDMPALLGVLETLDKRDAGKVVVLPVECKGLRILNTDDKTGGYKDDDNAIIHHRFKDADNTWFKRYGIPEYTMNKPWDKVAVSSDSTAVIQTSGVRSVAEIPPSPAVVPQSPVSITAGVPHLEQKSLALLKNAVRLVESGQNEGAISACEAAVLSLEEMLKAVQQRELSVTPENFNAFARSYISVCNLLAKCCMKTYQLEKADAVYLRLLQNPLVQLPMALKHEITYIRNQLAAVLKDKISSGDSLAALQSISPLNNDRAASTRRSDIRIALIVSIPNRAEGLRKVIQAIQPQVDEIRILLNGFSSVPNDLKNYAKVSSIKTSSSGHLYASGVWDILLPEDNGYMIVLDDDIEYPADYADKMIEAVENHQRRAVVVVHGMTFKEPFEDTIKDREVYYFQAAHKTDTVVHTGGVGTLVFHTDTIRPKVSDFPNPNFRDMWFSILAARKKVPIVCIARNRRWLVQMDTQGNNLWDMSHEQQWRDRKNEVFRNYLLPLLNVRDKTAALPKVSIVMSCHNEEAYLAECLNSIVSQTFTDWELIVTDDGSTDRTRSILQAYAAKDKRIRLAFFDDKKGPYVRRNYAISQSRAPFISIQDADDVMMPDKLAILYRHITGDDRLAIVGSWYRRFLDFIPGLEFGDLMKKRLRHEELMEVFPQCWHLCWHGSAIIRKSLFDQIGMYDEQPWGSDTFWLSKAGLYGYLTGKVRFMNVSECLTLKREHAGSQTGRINPADPRNRRHHLEQLYLSKLQAISNAARKTPAMDIARSIQDCTVRDFIATYGAQFEHWESAPVTNTMLQSLINRVRNQIEAGLFVSAVISLNVIEGMDASISQKCPDFNLVRALALYAAGHDGQAAREADHIPADKKNLFEFDFTVSQAKDRKRRVLDFYIRHYKTPSITVPSQASSQIAGKC